MNKSLKILPLLLVVSLTACTNLKHIDGTGYYFYTEVSYSLYANDVDPEESIKDICRTLDSVSDPYEKRDLTNVFDLNLTNNEIEIGEELYYLLEASKNASEKATNFNPLIGSLSEKWKATLGKDDPEPLSNTIIQDELAKIASSSYVTRKEKNETSETGYKYYAQRNGEALLDLGAITKGYALDRLYECFNDSGVTDYIVNASSSSILLGKNTHATSKVDYYTVGLRDVPGVTFKAKECVISSSGNDIQGVKIGNTMYSHIINPNTGSAIMDNDAVIVITDRSTGYLGDALSTSMMMNSVEEIKEIEKAVNAKTIVVRNNQIVYYHPDIVFLS